MVQEAQSDAGTDPALDFRSILEHIPAITYVAQLPNPHPGPLLYVSPQSSVILGYKDEWLEIPRFWGRILHPDDRDAALAASLEAHRSGEPWNMDYRLIARDGRVVWIRDHATLVRDEEGRPLRWHGVMLDVTSEKLAAEDLRESQARYRAVIEHIPAITYTMTMDRPGRTIYISPQVETILGYSPEAWSEAPGMWASRLHPADRERVRVVDRRTNESGEPFSMEYRLVAADGRSVWFHDEARVVCDGEGRPLFWQGVMLDITNAKLVEWALRESEARYRALVENIPAVVYIVAPDDDSTTLYVSPQIERILGYSQEEWLDQPDIWMELLHADDREEVLASHDLHNESGDPWRSEYRLIAADGRVVWFRDEATLVRGDDGRPLFWQGVRMDITDRRRAEEALERARDELEMRVLERTEQITEANELMMLEVEERRRAERQHRQAEDRLRTLIEQLPAVVYVWHPDRRAEPADGPAHPDTFTSPEIERILGFTPAEWQQRAYFWFERVHPEDRERVWAQTKRCEDTGEPFEMEYRCIAKDGRAVWVHERATAMAFNDQGKPAFFQGVMFDITERKRAEERVRAAEERYRTLVEEMPAVVYVWRSNPTLPWGETLYTSPQIERLVGYTQGEWNAEGGLWPERLHPDDAQRVFAALRASIDAGDAFEIEYRLLAKDGEVVSVHERAVPVELDDHGRPRLYQGVMLDVTERRRAEARLREAEEMYRRLVEQIPAVAYVESATSRAEGPRTLYISPQVCDMLGYSNREITADPDLWVRILHPEDRARAVAADERATATGEPFDEEYRFVAKDGHVVWVRSRAVLIRDDEGRPRFWQGVTFDITRQKGAEEELRRLNDELASRASEREEELHATEELLAELVADGPGIIFRGTAPEHEVTYVSPNVAQVLGYRPEDLLASHWWTDHLHPDDLEPLLSQIAAALERKDPLVESDQRLRHRDGSYRTFHNAVRYRYDGEGNPTAFLGVAIDITHRTPEPAGGVGFEPTRGSRP